MAHLVGAAQVHPGAAAIGQGKGPAVVEAGVALQPIETGQAGGIHAIHLTPHQPLTGHGHRKRAQVVEHHVRQYPLAEEGRITEPVVVAVAALEGAVDEDQLGMALHGVGQVSGACGHNATKMHPVP